MSLTYRPGGMLPGGFPFTDPITGRKFDGFDAGGGGDQVMRIKKYRDTNPHIFKDPKWHETDFIWQQVLDQQIQRLGGDRRFFMDVGKGPSAPDTSPRRQRTPPAPPPEANLGRCQSCGGELEPIYCKTCRGKRVVGTKCKSCRSTVGR